MQAGKPKITVQNKWNGKGYWQKTQDDKGHLKSVPFKWPEVVLTQKTAYELMRLRNF